MASAKLKIEHWPIERLTPYPNNPRKNDGAVDRMCESIREFGFRVPIVATAAGEVCDGHLRLKAAIKLGMKTVPVAPADELNDIQIKAFRLTANHSANWAEWDMPLLTNELHTLEELGFDIERFGLDEIELPELEDVAAHRSPRKKTTIFVSVLNADVDRARKAISSALKKIGVDHNL